MFRERDALVCIRSIYTCRWALERRALKRERKNVCVEEEEEEEEGANSKKREKRGCRPRAACAPSIGRGGCSRSLKKK